MEAKEVGLLWLSRVDAYHASVTYLKHIREV